ncbi:MAG: glycosyltransferase family 9 protein [Bdellovibrionales bacterium]|nr:glycosyltransferase family 9 protein [Bdellovibrionales bacterium]
MGSLGDVARGLSLPARIKKNYPNCKITWLVEPACKSLVYANKYIDQVLVFERQNGITAVFSLYKKLSELNFDITLDLQRHFKSGFFSWLSNSPRRIGFNPKNSKELNYFFNNEFIPPKAASLSKIEHYHCFLDHLEIVQDTKLDFGMEISEEYLNKECKPYVCLVLGSTWKTKDWNSEAYIKLIEKLLAKTSFKVFLLGSKDQEKINQEILNSLQADTLNSLVGKTSILELCSVLKGAEFTIGPDSGPGHLCSIVETPYVTLFGPTDPSRVCSYGNEHLVVKNDIFCSPCNKKVCYGPKNACMRLISSELVFKKLEDEGLVK